MANHDHPLHFLHIRKTGGTAIRHALRRYRSTANLVLHGHHSKLDSVPAGEGAFFFLRDPLSRFVSGFYSRQREGRPRYFRPWNATETEAFGRYRTPNELACQLSSSSDVEREEAERALHGIQHLRSRYWDWLISPAYLQSRAADIFFIGLQENLGADFAILREILALPDTVQLPRDDVVAHRNPAALDRRLDTQAVQNLNAHYREDYLAIDECSRIARENGLPGSIREIAPRAR